MLLQDTANESYQGLAKNVQTKEAPGEAILEEAGKPAQQQPLVATEKKPDQAGQKKNKVGPNSS